MEWWKFSKVLILVLASCLWGISGISISIFSKRASYYWTDFDVFLITFSLCRPFKALCWWKLHSLRRLRFIMICTPFTFPSWTIRKHGCNISRGQFVCFSFCTHEIRVECVFFKITSWLWWIPAVDNWPTLCCFNGIHNQLLYSGTTRIILFPFLIT